MVSTTTPKDPVKAAAGRAGMRARWGPPRVVRLDGLPGTVRDAVVALIEAQRASETMKKADPVIETSGSAEEVRRASDDAS